MVNCPKCKSEMRRVYDNESLEKIMEECELKDPIKRAEYEFNLANQWICNKQECSFIRVLKKEEIMMELIKQHGLKKTLKILRGKNK